VNSVELSVKISKAKSIHVHLFVRQKYLQFVRTSCEDRNPLPDKCRGYVMFLIALPLYHGSFGDFPWRHGGLITLTRDAPPNLSMSRYAITSHLTLSLLFSCALATNFMSQKDNYGHFYLGRNQSAVKQAKGGQKCEPQIGNS
jgi:hypothetical protein